MILLEALIALVDACQQGTGEQEQAAALACNACSKATSREDMTVLSEAVCAQSLDLEGGRAAVDELLRALSDIKTKPASLGCMWIIGRALVARGGAVKEGVLKRLRDRTRLEPPGDPAAEAGMQIAACTACEDASQVHTIPGMDDAAAFAADVEMMQACLCGEEGGKAEAFAGVCSMALMGCCHRTLRVCERVLDGAGGRLDRAVWGRVLADHVTFAMKGGDRPLIGVVKGCEAFAVRMLPHCIQSLLEACQEAHDGAGEQGDEARFQLAGVVSEWLRSTPHGLKWSSGGACQRSLMSASVLWREELVAEASEGLGTTLHASFLEALTFGDGGRQGADGIRAEDVIGTVDRIKQMPADYSGLASDRLAQVLLAGASHGHISFKVEEVRGALEALPSTPFVVTLLRHLPTMLGA